MVAVTSRPITTSLLRRVLIVDDNADPADNIAEILGIAGHTTQVATSAEEGLSKALTQEPDVVVTDYRLPGVNGAVFVKALLVTRPHVRAMVMSAYTDDTTIEEAMAAGAAFMGKPLDYLRLSAWVSDVLLPTVQRAGGWGDSGRKAKGRLAEPHLPQGP
jgi:DNA-binding NtrC family response regulator